MSPGRFFFPVAARARSAQAPILPTGHTMTDPNKTLVLIDGHASVHRAYHAIKDPLTNSRGEPTSAVYTFLNLFMRLRRQIDFRHIAVVFDPHGPTFRDTLYGEYKAHRESPPDDLIQQDRRIRELLQHLRVPMLELPGFEADDVIAALALRALENGGEALVCSVDKDLLQMVRPGIRIWREHLDKTEVMDEAAVVAKLGITPSQVPDYLAIIGDTSDNIPGVKGVGETSARPLLQKYGTLEGILASLDEIRASKGLIRGAAGVADKFQQQAENARLSRRLATLDTECVKQFDWGTYLWEFQPNDGLREFARQMEFHSFLREIGGQSVAERVTDYAIMRCRAELENALAQIRESGLASIDTETTDLDPYLADLVGISISWRKNQAVYIPVGHRAEGMQISREDLRELLAPALRDPTIQWIAHHWDFDYKILKMAGLNPGNVASDTMLAAYLVNPERPESIGLKGLALTQLGVKMTEISELIGGGDDLVTMASVSIEDSGRYACQDADMTRQLHELFLPRLREAGMERLFTEVEIPLTTVLAEMELEGVRIDREHFRRLSKDAEKDLEAKAREIHQLAGRSFNINSPKQVGEILFDELKLPGGKKGKTGAYGTDVSVLEALKEEHLLPSKLLEYRSVEKLKGTYLDPLPGMIHPKTGRLHTSYNQTVAATGRLSSSNPNLQNIPVRTEAGRKIREGFLPRADGWKLLGADYSQIELRILASLSGDAALCESFRSGADVHAMTASKVFNVPLADVTSTLREQAKAINFGIIYGMSDFRLARDLEIPRAKARQFIDDYFAIHSGVRQFLDETIEKARRDGFVTTLLGRRRFVSDITSRNVNQRNAAERVALNTPIQGTSADMIKIAMIRIAKRLDAAGLRARMILQVHDELIFDAPEDEIDALKPIIEREMTEALPLQVPIRVSISVGNNWAEI